MDKRYLSVREVSEYMGLARMTIYHWIAERKINCYKFGRLVKFDMQEIEKFIESRKVKKIEKGGIE